MKKLSLVCMAALLIMAASCKKEEKNEKFDGGFRAKTETHAGDSKTQLVDQKDVIWSEGDQITVFSEQSPNGQVFTATESGKNDVIFSADVDETYYSQSEFTSVYPDATKSGDNYQITLGATQAYTENGFASGANPMTAHSTNTTLNFKNVCGLLQLNLYSETTISVTDITLTSNKNGEKLNGNGILTIDADGIPTLANLDGGNALTLDCDNGVALGEDAEHATAFFFVVPAGALTEGISVEVTDANGGTWTRTTANNCLITRSMITSLVPILVQTEETCTEVQLWANGPYWSTCNLGAEKPHLYGDYYVWGATSESAIGHIATHYLPANKPAQTGSDPFEVTFRDGLLQPDTYVSQSNIHYPGGYYYPNTPYYHCDYHYAANSKWTKYTGGWNGYAYSGTADKKYTLEPMDDIAYELSDGALRMPTKDEFNALLSNTNQTHVTNYNGTGVNGWLITGKGEYANKHIFLPEAGLIGQYNDYYGSNYSGRILERGSGLYYWSSTLYVEYDYPVYNAYALAESNNSYLKINGEYYGRWFGFPVRPIKNN